MVKENNYTRAFIELNEIIKYFDDDIKNKIPDDLKETISTLNQDEYKFVYNKNIPLYEQPILPETKALLSILYSDYLCSQEEKEKWDKYDDFEQQLSNKKVEEQKRENFNCDDIFKNKQKKPVISIKEEKLEMIEYKEQKWYQKLFAKILKLLKRNNINI